MIELRNQQKQDLLINMGYLYQKEKLSLALREANIVFEEEGTYLHKDLIKKIELILNSMRVEYALVIQKEYLENNHVDWWKCYYSKATYEAMKSRAIDVFLSCLYD
ncbi:MAG: hypothetical protein RR929_02600 [Erysipelotrichaceae bacterium]